MHTTSVPKEKVPELFSTVGGRESVPPVLQRGGGPGRPKGRQEGGKGEVGEGAGARPGLGAGREGGRLVGKGRRSGNVRRVNGGDLIIRVGG